MTGPLRVDSIYGLWIAHIAAGLLIWWWCTELSVWWSSPETMWRNVTWAAWFLKLPHKSTVCTNVFLSNNKDHIKAPCDWTCGRGIHRSPQTGPVIREPFPCQGVIVLALNGIGVMFKCNKISLVRVRVMAMDVSTMHDITHTTHLENPAIRKLIYRAV